MTWRNYGLLGALGLPHEIQASVEREFQRWRREDAEAMAAEPETNVIWGVDFRGRRDGLAG